MERASDEYYSTRYAKYYCGYHFVWIPRYRENILVDSVAERLKELIVQIAELDLGCSVKALEVTSDHVHLFVVCPPRLAPAEIIKHIKGKSARLLMQEFPELRSRVGDGKLWTREYFVSTVGHVNEETIQRYIEQQRKRGDDNAEEEN
ncbi:IS200/IS605 family transposase [Stygiolobus azoricus]|uniref:IS200/IS605 family transposase n=1 Tax=Stygiolobus azoricus TaxID=41675 RepID=A0A650CPE3_9CREN|nr:IS200/IS605 family transposase [Stygiolobus azoricus]QGR19716.1 IS200/IS605 family transposase [Stygiolobus azoricus]